MSLRKFRSAHHPFYSDFSKLVDTFLGKDMHELSRFSGGFKPAVNVSETNEAYFLELVAPGREKADFKIDIDGDLLTLAYDKKAEAEDTSEKYTRKEFSFSIFKRSFTLPETVETDAIEAKYDKGVLTVTLPKKEEVVIDTKRTIEIA